MSTFPLAISCLTTSNVPWFMNLKFQVPMQYCSLQHQNLLLSPVTSSAGIVFALAPSLHSFWSSIQFSSVQSLSHVCLFATSWIAVRQASLSITISWSSLKLTSVKSVMPSSHLILCCPLLFLPPIPPSIRIFSNESTLHMRWPKYWSFSFSIIPSKEIPGLISFRTAWLDLLASNW